MVLREEGVEEATALPRVGCPKRSGVTQACFKEGSTGVKARAGVLCVMV